MRSSLLMAILSPGLLSTACGGDDAPCQAVCADAYCRDFGNLPDPVCTQNCTTGDDCAGGWSCNDMGRCRPPDAWGLTSALAANRSSS